MDTPSPSLQPPLQSTTVAPTNHPYTTTSTVDSSPNDTNLVAHIPPPISNPINNNNSNNNNMKTTKNEKKQDPINISTPSSSTTTSLCSLRRVRVLKRRKKPKIFLGSSGRCEREVGEIALPLGMSIAAVVAQVLERKDEAGDTISVDHLSMICTLAVKESLANVFGDKFDCFVSNFEKSFRSTLSTLRLISESSLIEDRCHLSHVSGESSTSDATPLMSLNNEAGLNNHIKYCHSEAILPTTGTQDQSSTYEEVQEVMQTGSLNQELVLHGQMNQQLACVSPSTLSSAVNQSMLSTFEKSVTEQTRANDLKTFEISLLMRKLQLKETKLALDSDSNLLERLKLSMGISRASFKAEKFKNQVEDTRHSELLKKCIDCLVAGLLIMSASLAYGAYIHSYRRIAEATASCTPPKESASWWIPKPMASFNSGLYILSCQVQVVSRMLFGLLMILAIAYLLLQRSAASNQAMPVTFILLMLGVACGFAGKLCVDTLGGNGYHWLLYWEVLCSLHFFSNVCTSALFFVLHGPITVSQMAMENKFFPYWIRRFLFYAIVLLLLPLFCGLMPFASPGEWKDHFLLLVTDYFANSR